MFNDKHRDATAMRPPIENYIERKYVIILSQHMSVVRKNDHPTATTTEKYVKCVSWIHWLKWFQFKFYPWNCIMRTDIGFANALFVNWLSFERIECENVFPSQICNLYATCSVAHTHFDAMFGPFKSFCMPFFIYLFASSFVQWFSLTQKHEAAAWVCVTVQISFNCASFVVHAGWTMQQILCVAVCIYHNWTKV